MFFLPTLPIKEEIVHGLPEGIDKRKKKTEKKKRKVDITPKLEKA